jgi:hypothetical protein
LSSAIKVFHEIIAQVEAQKLERIWELKPLVKVCEKREGREREGWRER